MTPAIHTIKQGDTGPPILAAITGRTGAAQDLTGATVTLTCKQVGSTAAVSRGVCTVVGDPTLGNVSFDDWPDTAVWKAGDYQAEFKVAFASGMVLSFPNDGAFLIRVVPQLA